MKNLKHPSFIVAIISIFVLFIGIGIRANGDNRTGDAFIIASIAQGFIYWVWTVIDVVKRTDLKPFQKRFG